MDRLLSICMCYNKLIYVHDIVYIILCIII